MPALSCTGSGGDAENFLFLGALGSMQDSGDSSGDMCTSFTSAVCVALTANFAYRARCYLTTSTGVVRREDCTYIHAVVEPLAQTLLLLHNGHSWSVNTSKLGRSQPARV